MKVDLLGLGMAIGGDYATLEIILKESLHKRISLTNPLVVRPADTDVDFAVAAIIDLIKEGEAKNWIILVYVCIGINEYQS